MKYAQNGPAGIVRGLSTQSHYRDLHCHLHCLEIKAKEQTCEWLRCWLWRVTSDPKGACKNKLEPFIPVSLLLLMTLL